MTAPARRARAKLVLDELTHRAIVRRVCQTHGLTPPRWVRPLEDDVRRYRRAHRIWADTFASGGGR